MTNPDDELGLPEQRPLPPGVHDRTLSRLEAAMTESEPTPKHRTALLAAAAVTVVALGVGLAVVVLPGDEGATVAAPPSPTAAPTSSPSPSPSASAAASPSPSPSPVQQAPVQQAPPSSSPVPEPTPTSTVPDSSPEPTPTSAVPDSSAEPTPAFVADTETQQAPGGAGSLTVTGMRTAQQDGYERVVFELSGDPGDLPGFFVGYLGGPAADPSGEPLDVDGEALLTAFVRGVATPGAAPQEVVGSVAGGGGAVQEVQAGPIFEGQHQFVIGLDAERPFRVRVLDGPPRVVVDILTS